MNTQRAPNVVPMPGPGILSELTALIDARIEQRLRLLGAVQAAADPRSLRQARGIEIRKLSELCGISAGQISRLERGLIQNPDPATVERIANGLGVSVAEYRCAVAALLQTVRRETPAKRETKTAVVNAKRRGPITLEHQPDPVRPTIDSH